jgi:macrolide-specific efflux system membrane fusion protein
MKQGKKTRFYKKKKFWIVTAIILAVIGFSYYKISLSKKANVQTAKIERGEVSEELVLSGEVDADEYANLTFPTSGEISWVGVKEGDEVKAGQALLKLDTTVLNSAFQQTRATLRAAEATVANIHDQVKDHSGDETFVQKDTRTTAEAAKDKAYESYIAAEYNLRNSTITAPFAGIITYLAHPFSGVNILVTETQAELINPKTIYFEVSADQTDVESLFRGQKVSIVLDAVPSKEFTGLVDFISYSPKPGEVGAVYKVKVKLDESLNTDKYRIGMTGDAKFILSSKDNVLYVPPKYVKGDTMGKYIKLGDNKNKTYIEIGIEGEDRIEIKGNFKEGDTVFN